jgi:hypothetical protein
VIIGKLIPAGSGAPANVAARKARERQAALEALAGEALEGLGQAEYNPFLEDGSDGEAGPDDEAAGLALAATIAGGDTDDEGDGANPFLTGDGAAASDGEATDEDVNPFLADADVDAEPEPEKAPAGKGKSKA